MKIPLRGEIWKSNNTNKYYHIVWLDKFSVNCVTKQGETYGVMRMGTLNFLKHHHLVAESFVWDVADLFRELVDD